MFINHKSNRWPSCKSTSLPFSWWPGQENVIMMGIAPVYGGLVIFMMVNDGENSDYIIMIWL